MRGVTLTASELTPLEERILRYLLDGADVDTVTVETGLTEAAARRVAARALRKAERLVDTAEAARAIAKAIKSSEHPFGAPPPDPRGWGGRSVSSFPAGFGFSR